MIDYRKQSGYDHPPTDNPAGQPKAPGGKCDCLPIHEPPTLKDPEKCPDPPSHCNCPKPPTMTRTCLEKAIDKQARTVAMGKKAEQFQAYLQTVLTNAAAATLDYNTDKYTKLLKLWQEEDRAIVDLLRKLICAMPCWRCVVECYVCPILNQMRDSELRLYGQGMRYTEAHNLYDLRYWADRDNAMKQATFKRVQDVLKAWEKPAATIEKILTIDNKKLLDDSNKNLGTDSGKVVFDVFLRLIPMHLAIAPPATEAATTTHIHKEYTEFCHCDKGHPDDCCGPDVGRLSLRQRILTPQPYLVQPSELFSIICCLVEERYHPAKDAAAEAEANLASIDTEIAQLKKSIEDGLKTFNTDARNAIPSTIDCSDCGGGADLQPQVS